MTTEFLPRPHLPQGRVTLAAVSGEYPQVLKVLQALGIETIALGRSLRLPGPVACHADMRLFHPGGDVIIAERGDEPLCEQLRGHGFQVCPASKSLGDSYPHDVLLNCLPLGGCLFGRLDALELQILAFYRQEGRKLINVRQGYAKCSVAPLSASAAMTADRGLWRALQGEGIETLLLSPGGVRLEGYDHGFIGGCCFLAEPGLLCFFGDLDSHPEGKMIRSFCQRHGISVRSLFKGPLLDIGSVIPLKCESYR